MQNTMNISDVDDTMLLSASIEVIDSDDCTKKVITQDYDVLQLIVSTEQFVKSIAINTKKIFDISHGKKYQKSFIVTAKEGRLFINLLHAGVTAFPTQYCSHSYSPYFKLFLKMVQRYGFQPFNRLELLQAMNGFEKQQVCDQLNACVDAIRHTVNTSKFKRSLLQHTKTSLKNYRGALRYIDHLHTQRKRLLVIRLDLSYKQKYKWMGSDLIAVSLKECFMHREEFIRQLPKMLPKNKFIRYIWKTEFKPSKSLHHHFIIILDGSESTQDITIGKILGRHWENEITQGRGLSWNVNAQFDKTSPKCGVGMVHVTDVNRCENLKQFVIGYLCKPDYHLRWIVPSEHRAFGKSEERSVKRKP